MAGYATIERDLLEQSRAQLERLLGHGWSVTGSAGKLDRRIDAIWEIRRGDGGPQARVFIEAKERLAPNQAEQLLLQLRHHGLDRTWLVIAPWLSPRTRQVLEEHNVNYMDSTGNISLRTEEPTIIIRTHGSDQSPMTNDRPRRGITGMKAGHLIRELIDFKPPRRANELSVTTNLSEGYVSRLLDSLSEEALIKRDGKSKVISSIDWQGLLRARAGTYQLLKANKVTPALARVGRSRVLQRLVAPTTVNSLNAPVLATGSIATEGHGIRNTVDGALMLYVPPGPDVVKRVSKDLGVLRIDQTADADVLFLQPNEEAADSIFKRPRRLASSGLPCVAYSQLALDCLAGPGRLPTDGEALIEWMAINEGEWRAPSPLLLAVD